MKTLSLLTTVMFLTYFVSGCNSPKADTSPNSRNADEAPPLVGPDVEVWKLTLHVEREQGYAWIHIPLSDEEELGLERPIAPECLGSFEGVWRIEVGTTNIPASSVSVSALALEANGGAEFVVEEGHEELPGPKFVRDEIARHLVGKWRQTSDTTATVWLEPAPLVGPDVEVWKLTLHVDATQNYAWIDVRSDDTDMRSLDRSTRPEDVVSFEGAWQDELRTMDRPSSSITTITLTLDANGGAAYLFVTGHENRGMARVKDNVIRHLVGKWRQTSDTTATVWLEPAGAIEE